MVESLVVRKIVETKTMIRIVESVDREPCRPTWQKEEEET